MKLKKWISAVLAGILCLSLAGCMGNLYENAMTIDGTEISSGLYLMAQYSAYTEAAGKVEDSAKDVLKQKVEGQSATNWIRQRAEELCRRYVAVHRLCRDNDIVLSDQGQQNVEQSMQYWVYFEVEELYADNGISEATYRRYVTNQELANQLFESLYEEGGELAVSDEELKKAYQEQNGHIRYLSVPLTSQTDPDTDMSSTVYAAMEAMVQRMEDGDDLETVAREEFPAIYELLGREFDTSTIAESINTGYIPYDDEGSVYPEEFREKLRGQQPGDVGYASVSTSALLYEVIPTFEDDTGFEDMRGTVLSAVKRDAFEDYLREIYEGYTVSWRFGAKWYLRPANIVD